MLCEKSPKIALRVSETLELSGGLQRPPQPTAPATACSKDRQTKRQICKNHAG